MRRVAPSHLLANGLARRIGGECGTALLEKGVGRAGGGRIRYESVRWVGLKNAWDTILKYFLRLRSLDELQKPNPIAEEILSLHGY